MPHYRLHRDPRSSHQQIARRVREIAGTNGCGPVLDVGAAQGMLGQILHGNGTVIDAVEMNPQWAEACKPYYRNVLVGAVEQVQIPSEKYGVIVCADVLEHTPDPAGVLKKLSDFAAPDAVYIISLPNVAHLAVRLMLLGGKFPKMDRGILDRTHLQFLTRDTATEMLASAGLKIQQISATGVPLDELWKNGEGTPIYNFLVGVQHMAISMLPRLFGMQFIFECVSAKG